MPAAERIWLLECLMGGPRRQWRVPITGETFRIGRQWGLDLILNAEAVSKHHAEIRHEGGRLHLRDLGSTNGCFVNQERVQEAQLHEGDILAFADVEFRLLRHAAGETNSSGTAPLDKEGARNLLEQCRHLERLLEERAVSTVFQPILSLADREVVAYEALGRGRLGGLPDDPRALFALAANLGREAELSALFRRASAGDATDLPDGRMVFVNSHPSESDVVRLAESVGEIKAELGSRPVVLEVHEWAIGSIALMGELKARLQDVDVRLAYDDFGAGHARLVELGEVPPDFLKFDMSFIRGIDRSPAPRVRLLGSLVEVARDLGVRTIAEGVETQAEADVCRELGFDTAQGFLFSPGRPASELG